MSVIIEFCMGNREIAYNQRAKNPQSRWNPRSLYMTYASWHKLSSFVPCVFLKSWHSKLNKGNILNSPNKKLSATVVYKKSKFRGLKVHSPRITFKQLQFCITISNLGELLKKVWFYNVGKIFDETAKARISRLNGIDSFAGKATLGSILLSTNALWVVDRRHFCWFFPWSHLTGLQRYDEVSKCVKITNSKHKII